MTKSITDTDTPVAAVPAITFASLGLCAETLRVLKVKGFEEPTPIQARTIPAVLTGNRDIIAQAQTGTGKTAAFGLPIIEKIEEGCRSVQVLVLAPTRELAIQVAEEIHSLIGHRRLSVMPVYGGQSLELQLRGLHKGIDIVVGTPGRVMDHLRRGSLKLDQIKFLVLDEADEMLNMGFLEDVREIMEQTNKTKRTLLFSATMPPEIQSIAKQHMGEHDVLRVMQASLTTSNTDQIYFEVSNHNKFEALCRIIDIEEQFYGLVFCRTKIDVDAVANHLIERGYEADALHGEIAQNQREKILDRLKAGRINILVATDVAARGIDINNLTHVINFSLPQGAESYIHRIGRTGRAGKTGIAITFVTPMEYRKLQFIRREIKSDIRKETLPKVKDVINTKKRRIKTNLAETIADGVESPYLEMAEELVAQHAPAELVAALLQQAFPNELNTDSYAEIEQGMVDREGRTRLFVSFGREEGATPRRLGEYIMGRCRMPAHKITDIQVCDHHSFVTVPFRDAEILLSAGDRRDEGPIFKKAAPATDARKTPAPRKKF